MKIRIVTAMIIGVMSLTAVQAQRMVMSLEDMYVPSGVNPQVPEDGYLRIDLQELPQAVTEAVNVGYETPVILEAYVSTREEGYLFKLVLALSDGTLVTTIYNAKGDPMV